MRDLGRYGCMHVQVEPVDKLAQVNSNDLNVRCTCPCFPYLCRHLERYASILNVNYVKTTVKAVKGAIRCALPRSKGGGKDELLQELADCYLVLN